MTSRTCPVCGSEVVLAETHEGARPGKPSMVYACTSEGCHGRLEVVSDQDATVANEPTGGDNIGA